MKNLGTAPLISVVVAAHNCEAYLRHAVASLTSQTIRDIEIIIVDDGSTDGTAGVAAECAGADPRIRVISRATASGRPACARNAALRIARGKYVAMLDGDDVALPRRFESAISAMQHTGARFAFADYCKLHQDTGRIEREGFLTSQALLARSRRYMRRVRGNVYLCSRKFAAFLLTFTAVHTPTVVFERALLAHERRGFDESLVCFEDVDLWLRLAQHTRFVFVNEVHALYRRHGESLTASKPVPTKLDGIDVRKAHLKRLRPTLSSREIAVARRTIADLLWDVSYSNWRRGNLACARAGFVESWIMKPSVGAVKGYFKAFVTRDVALAVMGLLNPSQQELRASYNGGELTL